MLFISITKWNFGSVVEYYSANRSSSLLGHVCCLMDLFRDGGGNSGCLLHGICFFIVSYMFFCSILNALTFSGLLISQVSLKSVIEHLFSFCRFIDCCCEAKASSRTSSWWIWWRWGWPGMNHWNSIVDFGQAAQFEVFLNCFFTWMLAFSEV